MQRIKKMRRKRREFTTEREPVRMVPLRLGGIYTLPNGNELIVGVGHEGHHFLYDPLVWQSGAWTITLPINYEIVAGGTVITGRGQPTYWRIEDLTDTGRSVWKIVPTQFLSQP